MILAIGTLQELIKHHQNNSRAIEELTEWNAKLEQHCNECSKCRETLSRK